MFCIIVFSYHLFLSSDSLESENTRCSSFAFALSRCISISANLSGWCAYQFYLYSFVIWNARKMYLYRTQSFYSFIYFLPDWYQCYFSDLCLENRSEMSTETCKTGDDFIVALLNVFSRMNSVPKALTLALEPYLDQARLWTHLYTLAGKFQASYCDTVLSFLRQYFFFFFVSALVPVSQHSWISVKERLFLYFRLCFITQ